MRSLGDADALRTNRLARVLAFPGDDAHFVEALQRLVRAILPPRSRLLKIVELCDIQGRPHKVVSSDLGLSMRQFYRERAKTRVLVGTTIAARLYVRVEHDRSDILADEFESLHGAVLNGHSSGVLRRIEELLDSGLPADAVAFAQTLRATSLADLGQPENALDAINGMSVPGSGDDKTSGDVQFSLGCMAYFDGRHGEAMVHVKRALELGAPAAETTERTRRAHARKLGLLGNIAQEVDDPAGAIEAFEAARHLLRSCRTPPQAQLMQVTADLALTRQAVPAMLDHGTAEALEGYRAATWHGNTTALDWFEVVLAFASINGADTSAFPVLRPASAAGTTLAGVALARMKLCHSRIATARGDAKSAIALIRDARGVLPRGKFLVLNAFADLREAEALLASGRPDAALPLAAGVIDHISFGSASHYSGAAHLAAGRAIAALGSAARAREHSEAGLTLLRRGGMVYEVAGALRFVSQITGDGRYAREERELLVS